MTLEAAPEGPLLEVRDLEVEFLGRRGNVRAVRGLSYALQAGESLGIVGESGSGKSVSALALLGLLPTRTARVTGSIRFRGRELVGASERDLRKVRGGGIALVFQDALSSLNPVLTIGRQIDEQLRAHGHAGDRNAAASRAIELLDLVGIPDARRRLSQYPHELSGGMRQRAMIAMALSCGPALLVADEPTTALDVTIQAQLLELLEELRATLGMSILLITHDLGVVAGHTGRVAVMYAGRVVEEGPTGALLAAPSHPYTLGLLQSIARLDRPRRTTLTPIPGTPPDLSTELPGCPFAPRCAYAAERCADGPPLATVDVQRKAACWFPRHGAAPSTLVAGHDR